MSDRPRFHLAFAVHDLEAARSFYGGVLDCPEGRSTDEWVDFDLCGHQIVTHLTAETRTIPPARNEVDGDQVPVPHFGLILSPEEWADLAERARAGGVRFEVAPHTRFAGETGEQSTMFFFDPSGNALEFKAFADPSQIFAR